MESQNPADPSESSGRLAIDPHVHSEASYDGSAPVRRLLQAASARGLDGIVVTDHVTMEATERAVDHAPQYDLIALPGVEVSTRAGHVLAIGVTDAPAPDQPFHQTVRRIRELGGVAVVPHPFQRSRHGVSRSDIHDCDGIETLNACTVTNLRNGQARRFAETSSYPEFGGSDAHVPSEVGRAYTAIELDQAVVDPTRVSAEAVLDALRQGLTRACGTLSKRRRSLKKFTRNARLKSTRFAKSSISAAMVARSWLGRAG
ncbi:MAG: CehA/McbA family metallohydrolase [Halobacteriales archaeon]